MSGNARQAQRRARSDRGAAGLLVVGGGLLAGGAAVVAGSLVAGALTHTRAQTAADLVALGVGAQLLRDPDPCAAGAELAARNDAALRSCAVVGDGVTVSVAVPLPAALGAVTGRGEAVARARAELEYSVPPEPGTPAATAATP